MAIYLKADGISGSVTEGEYKDWVELDAVDFAAGRKIKTDLGQSHNRVKSSTSASEFVIKK